ncbi:uncharacterized protein PRCAT00001620001 [Priceomyces carsonii]|uniref:uncharacterized protein n=1 Tax=Priceomyces carsonii TaxID=28549 RepID=UPI002ED84BCE|nr:unnamed protein product [Priceomyces carsonii]
MFENLKAFITHGKQANDIKKPLVSERTYGKGDEVYSDHSKNAAQALSNLPSESMSEITNALDDEKYYNASNEKSNTEHTKANNANIDKSNRYEEAASHIVEQEKIQRKKSLNFPNLERYQIMEQMGEGAFSVVYKATHLPTGQAVAIKILRKFQMDDAQRQSVLKEATIMRQLNHPNIVKFIEFIDLEHYYYIVQEIAVGGEVFTAIVKYTYFSEDLSRHVIRQVAEAVRYLHEEVGIVHRDIKPENLLYTPIDFKPSMNPIAKLRKSDDPNTKRDEGEFIPGIGSGGIGKVQLADFGLSKQVWEHNTKTPCGTVGYTAPEIVRDERYSKEVDMWAIGCVLYTLLCGFPPFYDESIETLTEKVARGEYTFLSPWWDEISQGAKHCVSKLLTVDPGRRYTIDDLLNDPWLLNEGRKTFRHPVKTSNSKQHPIQSINKKFSTNKELYSPAAVALRDAFDVTTAVHRMGEEAALSSRVGIKPIDELVEEDEGDFGDQDGERNSSVTTRMTQNGDTSRKIKHQRQVNLFDLNLGGASILERRKHKPVPVRSL